MRFLKRSKIIEAYTKHADAKVALRYWFIEARRADWGSLADVRIKFPSADLVGDRLVFNIRGNNYRLIVRVRFDIKRLYFRFFGTHAEYGKIKDVSKV